MKLRFASSSLAFLVAMTMATGAFAQGTFRIGSGTEPRGRINGHTEPAGDITLFLTNGTIARGVTESGTVVLEYGVPITNKVGASNAVPDMNIPDTNIEVVVCGTAPGTRLMGNEIEGENRAAVSSNGKTLTVHVDECGADQSIQVKGVLLSLVGSGATSITASISNTGDVYLLNDEALVIRTVVNPLTDDTVKVSKKLILIRHTGDPGKTDKAPLGKFVLVIEEAHDDSFEGAELELEFEGIPEDVTITLDGWLTTKKNYEKDMPDPAVLASQNAIMGISPTTVDADDDEATVTLVGTAVDLNVEPNPDNLTTTMLEDDEVDVIIIRGSINGTDDEDLLPIDLDIQVTVDLGPVGDDDEPGLGTPRFASDKTTAVTIIESSPDRTTLMVPFVTNDGTFETGIAVANMSRGGSAQSGAIMLDFYVNDGTKLEYTTSASSGGAGLEPNGMLAPGGTWSILLSQIFPGDPGNGYLVITTDFTGGDGNVFISDFAGFSVTGTVRGP